MELAGAVAALAADGVAVEDRLAIAVLGAGDVQRAVAVAIQAGEGHRPVEVQVAVFIAWRQLPSAGAIPADRRQKQVAVAVDEVRLALLAGTADEPHLGR